MVKFVIGQYFQYGPLDEARFKNGDGGMIRVSVGSTNDCLSYKNQTKKPLHRPPKTFLTFIISDTIRKPAYVQPPKPRRKYQRKQSGVRKRRGRPRKQKIEHESVFVRPVENLTPPLLEAIDSESSSLCAQSGSPTGCDCFDMFEPKPIATPSKDLPRLCFSDDD
jgi:hypothetical protein